MTSTLIEKGAHRSKFIKTFAEFAAPKPGVQLRPLNDIRAQIWRLRAEYWYRRVSAVPTHLKQARVEAVEVWNNKLSKPVEWTWGDAATGLVYAVNIVGAFILGEVLARNNLLGYDVEPKKEHHH